MGTRLKGAAKRLLISLLLASGLGGCAVYGPPYAYDSYPGGYGYGYPAYVGPPVTLDLGFQFYDHGHRHGYHHGYHHGYRGHGGGGWHGGRGWNGDRGHHGGRGWHGGRGRR